ncbi:dipeptide/oligopeptide/nickel ABC transporter permease/ATP-binding protein [Microbacterium halophytorum]|uniref:dipeptide/oligopeptide/nickel ABC transporter permease/ATP-binding protein n=1 Tax=Microbacterium halophytorum TaxID=2067568 RepID=UPI001E62B257|nr:dipeptide/oligopeptide/nickel ABC transporter permease/ATP-binding protein [Microbacterium halophytorum]
MSSSKDPRTTHVSVPSTEAIVTAKRKASGRTSTMRKLLRDPQFVITSVILALIFLMGLLTPWIAPHGPNEAELSMVNAPVGTPSYPLGADESGRDIFSRLLHSTNTALVSAVLGTGVAVIVGVIAGLVGGYYGRRTRFVTEWLFNLLMTVPGVLILIVLMPVTGGDYRITMLIFGVLLAPGVYRIVRNLVLGVKNELYVDAARVSGLGNLRILGRHVLSIVRGPIIIAAAFMAGSAINVQSGLAFLGVGSLEIPSFGAMISSGFRNLYIAPTQFLWPSLVLGVITAGFVLLGNSLRDALEGSKPKGAKIGARPTAEIADAADAGSDVILEITDLHVAYPAANGDIIEVVKGVSLAVRQGEVLGLVGESGSGKSQTAFSTLGVLPNEAMIPAGSIRFEGRELLRLSDAEMRKIRGSEIAYIPQEPMSNLDPSYRIGSQLVEGVRAALPVSKKEARSRVLALLERVGIPDPQRTFDSYPHEISGGMAQRALIAGAVASRPKLLIADEPTTALDVTVQAEILDLLRDLQEELGMAVLIVTHNFGVVADVCDRVAVMKKGEIVEHAEVREMFGNPQHEYTKMLLGAILSEESVREDAPTEAGGAA